MAYYLEQHRQRLAQWNRTRRGDDRASGVVVIHTAENATVFSGRDTGAESVANYVRTRTNYGSYHRLVDSDSTIAMAPWSAETFHDTATNRHSVGISAAVRAADWNRLAGRGLRIVDRMAVEAADFIQWIEDAHGVTVPVRMVTRAQAVSRMPGFVAHGTMDPGRRTDPGADFPWSYFLERVRHHLGQNTATTPAPAGPSKAVLAMLADLDYPDVRAAQEDLGLVTDGVAGPITTKALGAEMSKLDDILELTTKNNHALGRMEPLVRALAAAPEGGDIDPADIAHIRKRVEQNNAALGRMDPGKKGERA